MYRVFPRDHLAELDSLERELLEAKERQRRTLADRELEIAQLRARLRHLGQSADVDVDPPPPVVVPRRARWWMAALVGLSVPAAMGALGFARASSPASAAFASASVESASAGSGSVGAGLPGSFPGGSSSTSREIAPSPANEELGCPGLASTPPEAADVPAGAEHEPLTAGDYEALLASSRSFFKAIEERDGKALASLVHPTGGVTLRDEGLTLDPEALLTCFSSGKRHTISNGGASDSTRNATCREVFRAYLSPDYTRAHEVTFNRVTGAGFFMEDEPRTHVFFYVPGSKDRELSWRGVALIFERVGGRWAISEVVKAYWTP
jgi:hypothetical protein